MMTNPAPHQRRGQKIGVLCLEVPPDRFPGSIVDATIFDCPVAYETVAGAWVDDILNCDPKLTEPAIAAACKLEADGATLLISNCGYFIAYKSAIAAAVTAPAAISSLLWLPHLAALRSPGRRIGIVTFDAPRLTGGHLRAAWPSMDPATLAISGLEGTKTWCDAKRRDAEYEFEQIWSDLRSCVDSMRLRHPELQFLLLECVTLCAFAPRLRQHTGLPVFDIVSLARSWLGSVEHTNR
jgi:hypothetical protein